MSSLPGMPGRLGFPSLTDPSSGGSGSPFDVPTGLVSPYPSPPQIVNRATIISSEGGIPPTTAGNTLVIVTTQIGTIPPYIQSTGLQIGVDWVGKPVFDGVRFYDGTHGPRNQADAIISFPPAGSGYFGWEEGTGVYYLECVPGGITSIQFPQLNSYLETFGTAFPFFAFVYELTPSALDVISDNMIEVDVGFSGPIKSTVSTGTITPSSGLTDIAFALIGKRELPSAGGGGLSVGWPVDNEVVWSNEAGQYIYTIYCCIQPSISATTPMINALSGTNIGTSASNFFYGGAMAAFATISGISGGPGGGTPAPPQDVDEFLPNVWIVS